MITIIALIAILVLVAFLLVAKRIHRHYRAQAQRAGYPTLGDYLRATPRSETEKKDAVDLALQGLVICMLGLIFPPFLLIGVFPLYYGARKVAHSSMGLGLFEDPESTPRV